MSDNEARDAWLLAFPRIDVLGITNLPSPWEAFLAGRRSAAALTATPQPAPSVPGDEREALAEVIRPWLSMTMQDPDDWAKNRAREIADAILLARHPQPEVSAESVTNVLMAADMEWSNNPQLQKAVHWDSFLAKNLFTHFTITPREN